MSILALNNVSLTVAGHQVLKAVNWQIHAHDKIALVGRNGMGKSSLLKLLQKHLIADSGQINQLNGLRIASLDQEVPTSTSTELVYSFLVRGLHDKGKILSEYHQE